VARGGKMQDGASPAAPWLPQPSCWGPYREILLASGSIAGDGALTPDTAGWLAA
jgi:hypothetical protein